MSGQIRPQLWVMAITVRPAQWLSHQLHTIALVGWKSVRLVSEMSGDMSSGRWENPVSIFLAGGHPECK